MKITIEGSKEEIITFVKELRKRDTKDLVFDCGNVKVTAGEILADEIPSNIPQSKEEEATLNTVKEIIKEPVAPVQQKPEKRQWSRKQKEDIAAIKKAYVDRLNEMKPKHSRYRNDIDDYMIVKMRDEAGMSFISIGKELKCSPQTAANRYNKAKGISET